MPDLLAPVGTFFMDLVAALKTSIYDPRVWLVLFFGFALGYGHGLWRWWVFPVALVVAIAADLAVRAYFPWWALPWTPPTFAGLLVFGGILVLGYVAGDRSQRWLVRRRERRP